MATDSDPAVATTDGDAQAYIHIQPSDDQLSPDRVTRTLAQLHRRDEGRLRSGTAPTYEWCFVATGTAGDTGDRRLDWYVGVEDGDRDQLERRLRKALPDTFEFDRTDLQHHAVLDQPAGRNAPDNTLAAVEYRGVAERRGDWQLPLPALTTFDSETGPGTWPLASALDSLATHDAGTILQLLVRPKADWEVEHRTRTRQLEQSRDTLSGKVGRSLFPQEDEADDQGSDRRYAAPRRRRQPQQADTPARKPAPQIADPDLPRGNRQRLERLATVDPTTTFTVNARAITVATDDATADATARALEPAFSTLEMDHYRVAGRVHTAGTDAARRVRDDLFARTLYTDPDPTYQRIPLTANVSRALVMDAAALGACCCTDGPGLGTEARRAFDPTPADRAGLELPPRRVLNQYLDGPGMQLGPPLSTDRTPLDADCRLPPAVQPLHTALFGTTGAGKTALGQRMHLTNHAATDGATVYIDSKGDGGPADYLRTHFARYGDLENVYYFDCAEYLPVFPVLSLTPLLEAGIDRERAVGMVTEAYIETLAAAMGEERFYSAEAAVEAIEHIVAAQFDPVHGADRISQDDIMEAATRFHETETPPPVSDGTLHQKLASIGANAPNTFDTIMSAATRRIGKATNDTRLAPLFTAQPDDEHADAGAFDLRETLDEDCVIVFDMGGYGDRARRLLAVAILGQLWRALERRTAAADDTDDLPLVNCYIEEAADIATTGVLDTLLSQGRAFGLAVTLAMQFPEQVRESHPRVYAELLNDVGTIVTGSVGVDRRLAERLATRDLDADAVADRLRALERGEWLVRPAAPFADTKPRPFALASPELPPGHPEGDAPLTGSDRTLFESALSRLRATTRAEHGVAVGRATGVAPEPDAADAEPASASEAPAAATSPIPHTNQFPAPITYVDEPPFPLVCPECDTRYPSTAAGMRDAIECHHSLADVDRESIPICTLDLQLTSGERAASDYSDAQLRFLTAVHMAHQRRFDPDLEYDIVWDSMTDLQAYVGIQTDAVDELLEAGLLREDCRRPHKLLTLTPEGRDVIGVGHREGVAHGDGEGDLSESSLHVAMVEAGARRLAQEFVGPDQPGATVRRYHEVDGGRLDAAVLDGEGEVVAALEAERINNDRAEAIPSDFDTIAACDPQAAWWIVKTRADGHAVLRALHDPPDGEARVENTYSENMPPRDYRLDTPGLTEVRTFERAREALPGPELS